MVFIWLPKANESIFGLHQCKIELETWDVAKKMWNLNSFVSLSWIQSLTESSRTFCGIFFSWDWIIPPNSFFFNRKKKIRFLKRNWLWPQDTFPFLKQSFILLFLIERALLRKRKSNYLANNRSWTILFYKMNFICFQALLTITVGSLLFRWRAK